MLVKSVDCYYIAVQNYGPSAFVVVGLLFGNLSIGKKSRFDIFVHVARLPVHLRNTPHRIAPGSAVREVLSGSFFTNERRRRRLYNFGGLQGRRRRRRLCLWPGATLPLRTAGRERRGKGGRLDPCG